jgi:hypothetical protein
VNPNTPNKPMTYISTSSDTTNYILKYRIQDLIKADLQLNVGKISLGIGGRYFGFMRNIDKFFYDILDGQMFGVKTGVKEYREEHNTGTLILDLRAGVTLNRLKFSIIVNNFMNTEFSLRPLTIEPPRMTQLQVIYKI